MKTEIKKVDIDWMNIKNLCRQTISRGDSKIEPTQEWKRKLLVCRHSPLRAGTIQWKWDEIPSYVSTHFARHHIGCEKFVGTSREDRTGVPRDQRKQTDMVTMQMSANIEALQNIAEKRLCTCADKTTREYMMDLRNAVGEFDIDVAWSMVPSCVRCGGCIEGFGDCHFYENLMKNTTREQQMNVQSRYDIYDDYVKKLTLHK